MGTSYWIYVAVQQRIPYLPTWHPTCISATLLFAVDNAISRLTDTTGVGISDIFQTGTGLSGRPWCDHRDRIIPSAVRFAHPDAIFEDRSG